MRPKRGRGPNNPYPLQRKPENNQETVNNLSVSGIVPQFLECIFFKYGCSVIYFINDKPFWIQSRVMVECPDSM